MVYIHALDPAIWEELAMARDQAAAAGEDARAARADAEDERAARVAADAYARSKDELFDYFVDHQLDMSILREVFKDPERVAKLHREVFG